MANARKLLKAVFNLLVCYMGDFLNWQLSGNNDSHNWSGVDIKFFYNDFFKIVGKLLSDRTQFCLHFLISNVHIPFRFEFENNLRLLQH